MGMIDDERVIWNVQSKKIGYADGKRIFDMDGHSIGWVDVDGKIYDGDDHHAGYVDPAGVVYDWNARKIGRSEVPHMELGAGALLLLIMR